MAFSHLSTHIKYADSDIRILRRHDAPFILCHFSDRTAARPGIKVLMVALAVFVISLFRTNAIPTEFPGRTGSLVLSTFNLRENKMSICVWCSGVRCVSCKHRTPILWSFIVLFTDVHLDIGFCARLVDVRPFMFKVANLIFALVFLCLFLLLSIWCVG
jgi:hypothetical protein